MALNFEHHQLPGRLTLLVEPNPDAHTAAIGFFVKAGARDEDRALMGVSHFLEHMMFKGTARRSADDVNREFDDIGANYNAWTSHEQTVYYAHVLPEYLPRAVDLLVDMLRPSLRSEDFDMEKQVILEEIGMYDDRPHSRLSDLLMEKHFGDHPLGYRVLGTVDTIRSLTVGQMRDYFQQRYSPDNIIIAAAGRIDVASLIGDLTRLTQSWQPTGIQRQYDNLPVGDCAHTETDERVTRHYIGAMSNGPAAQDPLRYAAGVMTEVIGGEEGSRLYWALVDPGLADEADLYHLGQDQAGGMIAFASCDPQRADQVEARLFGVLDQFTRSVDAAEIERAKNKLATLATLGGERPLGRMRAIGQSWMYLGEYRPLEEELQRLMAVTVEDVRQVVERYPFEPRTVVRLGPR